MDRLEFVDESGPALNGFKDLRCNQEPLPVLITNPPSNP
jgi:hypothetical protein